MRKLQSSLSKKSVSTMFPVRVPTDLLVRAKAKAKRQKRPLARVIIEGLETFVKGGSMKVLLIATSLLLAACGTGPVHNDTGFETYHVSRGTTVSEDNCNGTQCLAVICRDAQGNQYIYEMSPGTQVLGCGGSVTWTP